MKKNGKKLHRMFVFFAILLAAAEVFAAEPTELWMQTVEHALDGVNVDSQDNILVSGGGRISKLDPDGVVLWSIEGSYNAIDSEDNFIVAGRKHLAKYNSDFELIWEKNYTDTLDLSDYRLLANTDNEGNIIIAGYPIDSVRQRIVRTEKYDSEGNFLWAREIGPPEKTGSSYLGLLKIVVDSNNRINIVNSTDLDDRYFPFHFVATYDRDGDLLSTVGAIWGWPNDAVLSPDDKVIIAGMTWYGSYHGMIGPAGNMYEVADKSEFFRLAYAKDGNVILAVRKSYPYGYYLAKRGDRWPSSNKLFWEYKMPGFVWGVAVDSKGRIIAVWDNVVQKFKDADLNPPTLNPTATPTVLWPPNGKLTDVVITTNAKDDSGQVYLSLDIVSSEALGPKEIIPEPDIDNETGIVTAKLPAARNSKGNGRVYSIKVTATDPSGNSVSRYVYIQVPHDMKYKK